MTSDWTTLLPAVAGAAREAGAMAMRFFRPDRKTSARIWFKTGGSPVTEADIAIDRFLRDRLAGLRPNLGWLSEEAEIHPAGSDAPAWIVDPIDGTRAFMRGEAAWGVSIALVAAGRPALAALFLPASDRLFTAAAGAGAFLGDAPLGGHEPSRLAAGPKPLLDAFLAQAPGFAPHPKISSLAARVAAVAEGRIGFALASGGAHEWDVAAADLILAEAGGRLTAADAGGLRYEASPRRLPELIAGRGLDAERLARVLRETLAIRPRS